MMFPVSLIIIITQDEITCYMASFWRAHSHFLCSAVISLLSHLYPRPWKEHFYSPDSLWLEQSELPGRGSLSTKKKVSLIQMSPYISKKVNQSVFSMDSKCVWRRFGLFWQIQCTLITSKHSLSHPHYLDFIRASEKQNEPYLKGEVTFSVCTG